MNSLIFLVIIGGLLFWFFKKPKTNRTDDIDTSSKSYAQGYWDGYRARQREFSAGKPVHAAISSEIHHATETTNNQPTLTLEQQKEKHNTQNINIALYVASFLLVAAAALFIDATSELSPIFRFYGICIITIIFYVSGLMLHEKVPKLKPAAIAFVGTGLALIPFTGLAMYNFILPDESFCWFFTSFIGLMTFIVAALRLKSQVISYFAIAFAASLSISGMTLLKADLVWCYIMLIAFGSIMTIIAKYKPKWVPECFSDPIHKSNGWIVPLALVASLMASENFLPIDYAIISFISALYYCAVGFSEESRNHVALFVARLLGSFGFIFTAYEMASYDNRWTLIGITISIIGIVQVVSSAIAMSKHVVGDFNNEAWLWLGLVFQIIASLFVFQSESWPYIIACQLFMLALTSLSISYLLRRVIISLFACFAFAILPILISTQIIQPPLEYSFVSIIFIVMAALIVAVRSLIDNVKVHPVVRSVFAINFSLYLFEALSLTVTSGVEWKFSIWLVAAVLLYCLIYIEKLSLLIIPANILLLLSGSWFVEYIDVHENWRTVVLSWITFAVFYFGYYVCKVLAKKEYAKIFWWSAIVTAIALNVASLASTDYYAIFAAGFGLTAAGLMLAVEGWTKNQFTYIDAGSIVITIGLQRMFGMSFPETDFLVYTHWWAIMAAALGYMYFKSNRLVDARVRVFIALLFVSFFSGIAALSNSLNGEAYRLLFLMEHIFILLAGLIVSRKLFAVWGAVGVIISVLWMIKSFTYLILALLAFVLIGIAIYSLTKQPKK